MATAMRSAWILSILDSSAFCTSSMISGLLSRMSLMMVSSSLRWAGVNALEEGAPKAGDAGVGMVDGGEAGSVVAAWAGGADGAVVWPTASVAPTSRIA